MKPPVPALVWAVCFLNAASALGQTPPLTPEEEKRAALRMPDLDRSGLEPGMRKPIDVKPGERNPFGLLSVPPPEEKEEVKIEAETEEMKIRRILGNMRVVGVSGERGDYRVLVGSMKLAKGDMVPRLFATQVEMLRVDEINERQVLLSFVERKLPGQAELPPRTIGLAVDLTPRVRSLLPGEVFTSVIKFDAKGAQNMEPLKTESVELIIERFKDNDLTEALTDHRRYLLGETEPLTSHESAENKPEE
jgi:hypothetical protein